jgi:phosphonate transport system permease protein
VTATSQADAESTAPDGDASQSAPALPPKPGPSWFAIGGTIGAITVTIVTARAVGFSFSEVWSNLSRQNSVLEGALNPDWSQIWSERSRSAFLETVQLAVLGTIIGATLALPLALWTTKFGNPNFFLRTAVRSFNNVIRSIPDLLGALLFVSAVGIGALSGLLALIFFSLAVTTKLTSDTLDGIDMGPVEAANASGASLNQMLRTAVVPQVLPAYSSFVLYNFELNLRASAVLGLVGAGGIGARIEFFRGRGEWEELWGLVFMFFLVVLVVERISVSLRRRLV